MIQVWLLSVVLMVLSVISGCSSSDSVAVYKEYHQNVASLQYDKCIKMLASDDKAQLEATSKAYADYIQWFKANETNILKLKDAPELKSAAVSIADITSPEEAFGYHLKVATLVGGGEPKELPTGVDTAGDKATLSFANGRTREMVKEDGSWKVKLTPQMISDLRVGESQIKLAMSKQH